MHRLQVRRGCYQYSFFPMVYPWISRNQHLRTFVRAQPGSETNTKSFNGYRHSATVVRASVRPLEYAADGSVFLTRGSHFLSFFLSCSLLLLPPAPSISVTLFSALSLPSHNPIPPPVYVHAWKKMKKKSYSILLRTACARQ